MVEITKGNAKKIRFRASLGNGEYMDLTGASIVTDLPAECGEVKTIPSEQHTILDQTDDATKGMFDVRVETADTSDLKESFGDDLLEVVSTISQVNDVISLRGKVLRVYPPRPVS